MRNAYGVVCLVLGSLLVLAQMVAPFAMARLRKPNGDVIARTEDAVRKTNAAVTATQRALDDVTPRLRGLEGIGDVLAESREAADEAAKATKDAEGAVDEAKKRSGVTKEDVLLTLAQKVPLAISGILLIALGALIMGWIDLNVTAGAGAGAGE